MKKLISLVAIFLIGSVVLFAQTDSPDIQSLTISKVWDGVKEFWNYLNWIFIVAFIVTTAVFNMYVQAENKAVALNWFRKVPTAIWALLIGLLLAALFIFAFDIKTIKGITGLLFSIIFSMGIYKVGIDKFIRFLAEKLGLKFGA